MNTFILRLKIPSKGVFFEDIYDNFICGRKKTYNICFVFLWITMWKNEVGLYMEHSK